VVWAGRALAGERHLTRDNHDRHIRADEPQRLGRHGSRVVIDQNHAGAGQRTVEKRPVTIFDSLPAAPVGPVPSDEVGIVGEQGRITCGVAAVPGVFQGLAELKDRQAFSRLVEHGSLHLFRSQVRLGWT
jgi:hypothetical protein